VNAGPPAEPIKPLFHVASQELRRGEVSEFHWYSAKEVPALAKPIIIMPIKFSRAAAKSPF